MKNITEYISLNERISSMDDYISEIKRISSMDDYIDEGLKINSKTKVQPSIHSYTDKDFIYKVRKKSGEEFQWFTWWKFLMSNGPMSKKDLLKEFNLLPTSYSTQFAQLSKKNIIVPSHGKLEAKRPEEWKQI